MIRNQCILDKFYIKMSEDSKVFKNNSKELFLKYHSNSQTLKIYIIIAFKILLFPSLIRVTNIFRILCANEEESCIQFYNETWKDIKKELGASSVVRSSRSSGLFN